jgi:C4-dicarboxylate-specific signal transduction histidine kinase
VLAQNAVNDLNERLEHRVEERTSELFKTEHRMATLFEMSNITYAEQDLSDTLPILEAIRREGVIDLPAYMEAHPDVLDRCIASIKNVRVNSALARLLGYDSAEDLAATPPVQNADDARVVLLRQIDMAFRGLPSIEGRTVLIGKNGIRVPVFFNVHRLSDERQLSSHLDVTSQERIEEMRLATQAELARANRVATVGAFSASIAHELNQPIA